MKIMLQTIVLLLSLAVAAQAEIRELASLRAFPQLATAKSLVVLDLDNTVMETKQMLGSDQFFTYLVKKYQAAGESREGAIERALALNARLQPKSEVRAVERLTPGIIRSLQSRGLTVIALTARPEEWADDTLAQLRRLGVSFARSAPAGEITRDGVLFLPKGRDKGRVLAEFLDATNARPDRVLFIDDKQYHVESVEIALRGRGFENINFRYSAADERVRAFDPAIAEVQLAYFFEHGVFLSDEKARRKLEAPSTQALPRTPSR